MCHTRDGFSRIDFTLKKNTRPPRAHTVSTGPRYFHVSVRSASTNIGDHRGKPRQRRIERKATRLGERERERKRGEMDSSRFVLNSEWTSAFLTIEPRSREKIDSCEARAEELEQRCTQTRIFFISYIRVRTLFHFRRY